jgi:hypothetical protein
MSARSCACSLLSLAILLGCGAILAGPMLDELSFTPRLVTVCGATLANGQAFLLLRVAAPFSFQDVRRACQVGPHTPEQQCEVRVCAGAVTDVYDPAECLRDEFPLGTRVWVHARPRFTRCRMLGKRLARFDWAIDHAFAFAAMAANWLLMAAFVARYLWKSTPSSSSQRKSTSALTRTQPEHEILRCK